MESKRQQKMARLLKEDLSAIFQKDAKHLFGSSLITITAVRVSPDLSLARIYLSFLIINNENKDELLADIQDNTKQIRQILGQKIRHTVRIVPELQFFLDDTADYVAKMDALFDSLNIPPSEDEEKDKKK
jgi:ribosome-binding factor A